MLNSNIKKQRQRDEKFYHNITCVTITSLCTSWSLISISSSSTARLSKIVIWERRIERYQNRKLTRKKVKIIIENTEMTLIVAKYANILNRLLTGQLLKVIIEFWIYCVLGAKFWVRKTTKQAFTLNYWWLTRIYPLLSFKYLKVSEKHSTKNREIWKICKLTKCHAPIV